MIAGSHTHDIRAAAQNLALHVVAALAEALSPSPLDRAAAASRPGREAQRLPQHPAHARGGARSKPKFPL